LRGVGCGFQAIRITMTYRVPGFAQQARCMFAEPAHHLLPMGAMSLAIPENPHLASRRSSPSTHGAAALRGIGAGVAGVRPVAAAATPCRVPLHGAPLDPCRLTGCSAYRQQQAVRLCLGFASIGRRLAWPCPDSTVFLFIAWSRCDRSPS
ncbi:hypothetical protein, partial [Burkholderia sp. lig30]|uniref:hypothetical protein n=1 Tax=Burkholderia sp. lig30 TaxID=1192124 RepID=UPI001F48B522